MRLPHIDYIFHTFTVFLSHPPLISLAMEENIEYRWVTIEEGLKLPLVSGGKEALLDFAKERKVHTV